MRVCASVHAPKELEEQVIFTTAVVSTTIEAVSSTGTKHERPLEDGHSDQQPPSSGDAFLTL